MCQAWDFQICNWYVKIIILNWLKGEFSLRSLYMTSFQIHFFISPYCYPIIPIQEQLLFFKSISNFMEQQATTKHLHLWSHDRFYDDLSCYCIITWMTYPKRIVSSIEGIIISIKHFHSSISFKISISFLIIIVVGFIPT